MTDLIYLASPYTHPDPAVVEERYAQTLEAAAAFIRAGHVVYSPIVHCHEIARRHELPTDFEFWREQNETMLDRCDAVRVLTLPDWTLSRGIAHELDYATEHGIALTFWTLEQALAGSLRWPVPS